MNIIKKTICIISLIWGIIFTIGGIGATFTEKEGKIELIFTTVIFGILPLILAVYFLKKKSIISPQDELNDDSSIQKINQTKSETNTEKFEPEQDSHNIEEASSLTIEEDKNKKTLHNILKYLTIFSTYLFITLKFLLKAIVVILKAIGDIFKAIGEAGETSNSTEKQTSNNKSLFSELLSDQKVTCDVRYNYIFKGNSGSSFGKYRVHKSESAVIAEIRRLNPQRQNIVITSIKWKD